MKLGELIKQERFASPSVEATLNVIVTGNWILGELAAAMAAYDLTPAQYNVLRILNGSHPDKMTCSDIGARLLDRTPDVTRLLNRLEKRRLVDRRRSRTDRRVVRVGITQQGRDLLGRMNPEVGHVQQRLAQHLDDAEFAELSRLLERMRTDQVV